jgi:D-arabinose 1-dehydrogenase-like Zn-dependent alcohol dehydrogenase
VQIAEEFPLDDIKNAFDRYESGKVKGKIAIIME